MINGENMSEELKGEIQKDQERIEMGNVSAPLHESQEPSEIQKMLDEQRGHDIDFELEEERRLNDEWEKEQ